MNLILLSQILKRHEGFSFSTMRRIHNRSGITNSEVKFILCCFSFIEHGGAEDLFWRWIRRSNYRDEHKRSLLSFNRPSNNNVHSNEFLGLCQNFQFLLSFRAILETYPMNLGRIVDSTLIWGNQPEGRSFWSNFNSTIGLAWTAYRRFNKTDDGSTINPNVSVTSLRDSVFIPMSLRARGDTSLLSEFCLSYNTVQEAADPFSTRAEVADPFAPNEATTDGGDGGNAVSGGIMDELDRIASSAGSNYRIRVDPSPISWVLQQAPPQ